MSNSDARLEPAASATRQKSCNNCVKGKRRCDKRYPACSRCAERNVPCTYAKRLYSEAFSTGVALGAAQLDPPSLDKSAPLLSASQIDFDFFDSVAAGPSSTVASLEAPVSDLPLDPFLDFLTDDQTVSSTSNNMWLTHRPDTTPEEDDDVEAELAKNTASYAQDDEICHEYEPWETYDPNSKVHYATQVLKNMPIMFARETRTPFIHQHLYKDSMPSPILSCFSTCSMYSNMTKNNRGITFRALVQSARELDQCVVAHTPQEKLSRVHALLFYQIIRVFDENPTLRVTADEDMPRLQSWTDELCKVRENLDSLDAMDDDGKRASPPKTWEWWIFAESVRRTIIMAYYFITSWQLMTRRPHPVGPWRYVHRWTMSRHLWEAPSSFDFYCTWKEKPHYVVWNTELDNFLKYGKGDDLDDFAKMMLVTQIGLDETKQWFLETGSKFELNSWQPQGQLQDSS